MTPAQREALDVLARIDPQRARGHKRRSQLSPVPRINYLAASSLVRAGLARAYMPDPGLRTPNSAYVHEETYSITEKGREEAKS